MTPAFVIDVSFALASILPDEEGADVDAAMARLAAEGALVPDLFWHEMRNALLVAERGRRIEGAAVESELAALRALPIDAVETSADAHVVAIARAGALTAYDAAYLQLALTRALPLATLDGRLATASRQAGVPVIGA